MGRMDDLDPDNMEMPCKCQSCGAWFDLNDGCGSDKWYPSTVICEDCSRLEQEEIELDEEIENEQNNITDAEWQIKESKKELEKLQVKKVELEDRIEKQRYADK